MIYEIINPSDPYTVKSDDFEVAAIACFILGEGHYAFEPQEAGGDRVPIFLLGGSKEWTLEKFGVEPDALADRVLKTKRAALIECLESVLIGSLGARREFDAACAAIGDAEKIKAFRNERHEHRRSSMNDIGGRAYRIADRLRAAA